MNTPVPDLASAAQALHARIDPDQPCPELTTVIASCNCPEAARAGLYLLNGDWEAAHRVAQALHDPLGYYWHALVHRHEPDYDNSNYWFRRAGKSPVHEALVAAARDSGRTEQVLTHGEWDPIRFTDCLALPANPAEAEWARKLDRLEMQTLFHLSLGR